MNTRARAGPGRNQFPLGSTPTRGHVRGQGLRSRSAETGCHPGPLQPPAASTVTSTSAGLLFSSVLKPRQQFVVLASSKIHLDAGSLGELFCKLLSVL